MTLSSTLIESVKSAKSVAIIGNGGNLAIANHVGSDMNRYLGKFTFYPDAVHLTALSQDKPGINRGFIMHHKMQMLS